jgi:hypothetical protein
VDFANARIAGPDRGEGRRTKDFPAMRVGDVERQAAVRKALIARIHPVALDGRRTDVDVVTIDHIGDKLHRCLAG